VKWLEVVRLRSTGKYEGSLQEFMRSLGKKKQPGLVGMTTYRHAGLETDLAVHLCWDSESPEKNGSALGIRLEQSLKEFGLSDRSLWVEEKG
jgi:hypothetical protein